MQVESPDEIRIVPVGSGFIVYQGDHPYPASTAFICNKIVSRITRQIEQDSGMREHEFSAGKLNWKGASKKRVEEKRGTLKRSLKK